MGQESATYIDDLNASWPLSSDLIRYGAVHLRTIKGVLQATFPNLTGAVTLSHSEINDAARLSVRNIFSGTVSGAAAALQIESNAPGILLKELDAAADSQIWREFAAAGVLRSDVLNDAGAGANIYRKVTRTTTNIDSVEYITDLFQVTGKLGVSSTLELGDTSDTTLARSRAGVVSVEGIDLGFLGMPILSKSADYDLVLADAGKCIYHPSGGGANDDITIPRNATVAFPVETIIGFLNLDSNDLEINIDTTGGTDTLKALGSGSNGPFFLPQYCFAAAIKYATTAWMIGGQGLHT